MGSVEIAILKVAQEGGYLEQLPDDEAEIVQEANYYLREAQEAIQKSEYKKDKTVKAIVELGKQLGKEQTDVIFGSDKPQLFRGLPVPDDIHKEPVAMPFDFTELGPKEIMKLHAQYNAYLARARWMLSVATNKLSGVVHLRDAEYRRAYREISDEAKKKDEKPTKDYIDSMARADEAYVDYDNKARLYNEEAVSYKALVEIYSGNVDRLSREWTMRQDEEKRY